MAIKFYSKVISVNRESKDKYEYGVGEHAVFSKVDLGYFMLLEGSHESLHIGFDKPEFRAGDRVSVTIERIPNGR